MGPLWQALSPEKRKSHPIEDFFPAAAEVLKKGHQWLLAEKERERKDRTNRSSGEKSYSFKEVAEELYFYFTEGDGQGTEKDAKRAGPLSVAWIRKLITRAFPNDYKEKLLVRRLSC